MIAARERRAAARRAVIANRAARYGRPDSREAQLADKRAAAAERRRELAVRGLCINNAAHGRATAGVLCESCRITHRKSQ